MEISSMVTPNIAAMSMAMASNKTQDAVGTAVLAKTLDTYQANGAALTKMMEMSVNPSVGGNFDMSV